mmetsp:Transcript_32878/g.37660  ORF Transcript_32878/g.37660 Transcript_32878/m.37660 type:complete len:238 (-) Transcript_32878:6-719(-)
MLSLDDKSLTIDENNNRTDEYLEVSSKNIGKTSYQMPEEETKSPNFMNLHIQNDEQLLGSLVTPMTNVYTNHGSADFQSKGKRRRTNIEKSIMQEAKDLGIISNQNSRMHTAANKPTTHRTKTPNRLMGLKHESFSLIKEEAENEEECKQEEFKIRRERIINQQKFKNIKMGNFMGNVNLAEYKPINRISQLNSKKKEMLKKEMVLDINEEIFSVSRSQSQNQEEDIIATMLPEVEF